MQYIVSFLEGIITFVSPCLLPMLPVYLSYFAGDASTAERPKTLLNALGFVLGFTVVFLLLGVFAGSLGALLQQYRRIVDIVTGAIVILFGLNFIGVLKIGFLNRSRVHQANTKDLHFISAFLFGVVFSVGWTPCVGAFLGSALMLASQQGSVLQGMALLLVYSLGLGIPFLISAVLIEKLKETFNWIKRHYSMINLICGIFLILVGILMMLGWMGKLLSILSV